MALLGRLASETGMILITSVHQPSTRVFNSFDQASVRFFHVLRVVRALSALVVVLVSTSRPSVVLPATRLPLILSRFIRVWRL